MEVYTSKTIWSSFRMSREWLREILILKIITPSIYQATGTGQNHLFSYWDTVAFAIFLKLRELGIKREWIKIHLNRWQTEIKKFDVTARKQLKLLVIPYIDPRGKDIHVWEKIEANHFQILTEYDLNKITVIPDFEGFVILNLEKIIRKVDNLL